MAVYIYTLSSRRTGFLRYVGKTNKPYEEEAARAYDRVAREIFGNGAKLNFPEAFEEKTP